MRAMVILLIYDNAVEADEIRPICRAAARCGF
jgi:hypothetical protein